MPTETLDPTQTAQAATPATAPASTPASTVPDIGGQATQESAPVDVETFTKVDVKTLDTKDRESYNNMLRDYKTKTTEIAQLRKQFEGVNLEELRQKASLYDQAIQAQQAHETQTADIDAQAELQQLWQEAQTDPMKAVEFHRRIAQMEVEKVREAVDGIKQEKLEAEAITFVKSFATATDPKTGEPLRPEYDAVDDTGLIRHHFEEFLAEHPNMSTKDWPKAIETAWQKAKTTYDAVFQKGFQAALAKQHAKVEGSTEMPTGASMSNERLLSQKDAAKLTVKEAVELARQGIKIKSR